MRLRFIIDSILANYKHKVIYEVYWVRGHLARILRSNICAKKAGKIPAHPLSHNGYVDICV